MQFNIEYDGRKTLSVDVDQARELGYPDAAISDAMRAATSAMMLSAIEVYRQRLSGVEAGVSAPSPERIGIWAAKARIARENVDDPDATPAAFKVHFEREATARGRSLLGQMQRVIAKADIFEGLGLLIEAMEAEAEAGLSAVTDEQMLAGGGDEYLAVAKVQADAAFAEAEATVSAG